jgi:hypothetical protein
MSGLVLFLEQAKLFGCLLEKKQYRFVLSFLLCHNPQEVQHAIAKEH